MNILIKKCGKKISLFFLPHFIPLFFAQSKLAIVIDDVGYHSKEDAAILRCRVKFP